MYTDLSFPSSSSNFPNNGSGLSGSVEMGDQKTFLYIIPSFWGQDMNSKVLRTAASSASAQSQPSLHVVPPRAAECSPACWSLDFCVIASHVTDFTRSNYTPWLQQGPFHWHSASLVAMCLPFNKTQGTNSPTHILGPPVSSRWRPPGLGD